MLQKLIPWPYYAKTGRGLQAMGGLGAGTDFGGLEAGWELGWRI